jgi:putative transposase
MLDNRVMNSLHSNYKHYRFLSEVLQYAVWLYCRFNLSHQDIEDLLVERGINLRYEAVRLWPNNFGPKYTIRLKRSDKGYRYTFYIDAVFIKMGDKQHYLWRAVD